jgi:hypothetical protein
MSRGENLRMKTGSPSLSFAEVLVLHFVIGRTPWFRVRRTFLLKSLGHAFCRSAHGLGSLVLGPRFAMSLANRIAGDSCYIRRGCPESGAVDHGSPPCGLFRSGVGSAMRAWMRFPLRSEELRFSVCVRVDLIRCFIGTCGIANVTHLLFRLYSR